METLLNNSNNAGDTPMKKFRCKVCGYIYEGDELPADFVCSF